MRNLRAGFILIIVLLSTSAWASAEATSETQISIPKSQRFSLGLAAYFLQPYEVTGSAGTAPPLTIQPMVQARWEKAISWFGRGQWYLEPALGVLFPQTTTEDQLLLGSLVQFDLGWSFDPRIRFMGGVGADIESMFSRGGDVEIGGSFVTPQGSSLSWVLTQNFGISAWLDERLRIDAETLVSSLFDRLGRRFRLVLGVGYAL